MAFFDSSEFSATKCDTNAILTAIITSYSAISVALTSVCVEIASEFGVVVVYN